MIIMIKNNDNKLSGNVKEKLVLSLQRYTTTDKHNAIVFGKVLKNKIEKYKPTFQKKAFYKQIVNCVVYS